MKYWIDADERYPVFALLPAKDAYGVVVDVPDELVERYNKVCEEYGKVQAELAKLATYYD